MRYIGNKTKLLGFLGSVLDELGIEPGRAADPFAGTASVAQFLKRRGFATDSCDIMNYSYVLQRAYVELDAIPDFARVLVEDRELADAVARLELRAQVAARFDAQADLFPGGSPADDGPLRHVLVYLDSFLAPLSSFVTREYSAADDEPGPGSRMFFTGSNGRRIDAIRTRLHEWRRQELLTSDEFHLLLACLIEAADSVANTTGVYAAFVKSWQPNAVRPLRLRLPGLVTGTGLECRAHRQDANRFVRGLGRVDLVYLDPPYNGRQYSAYYHVPEVIAEGWFDGEPALRGKTGLIPDGHKRSDWSVAGECVAAFRDLIANVDARYVLLSYNDEGIIPPEAVEDAVREYGRAGTLTKHARDYARYRSDRDHEQRTYKRDRVTEYVYAFRLDGGRAGRRGTVRALRAGATGDEGR